MAHRVGFNALSIAANCIDGSRAARCCLRKICPHGLPSKPGRFLLCQLRHVTIALQLFFAPFSLRYRPVNVLNTLSRRSCRAADIQPREEAAPAVPI
jgi:hypothetical protein